MKKMAKQTTIDPVNLEIYWNRLITIMDETDRTLVRTAFSTIVAEGRDFACIILDANAVSLAQSVLSSTGFTVMLPRTTRSILEVIPPDTLEKGDVLMTNDPWIGTGHLPDITLVQPVFYSGKLVAYIAIVAHVADIGGTMSYFEGRDVYEEGIRILPRKLYQAGQPNEDLFELIRANVRVPDMVIGDIRAIVSAQHVGAERLREFLEDYDLNDLQALSSGIQERSETAMRNAIREISDGEYVDQTILDGHGKSLVIKARVEVDGDSLTVDFTGTSPQVDHAAINCSLNATLGDVLIALKCSLVPDLPNNEAIFRPVNIHAPEGSVLNCRFPAPCKGRSVVSVHTHEALYKALAEIIPDKVQASSGTFWGITVNGEDDRGKPFNAKMIVNGGKGAVSDLDGLPTTCFPVNSVVTPSEVFEYVSPLLIERKQFWIDSAGAGRTRGGIGQRLVFRSCSPKQITMTIRPVNRDYPPAGILDGREAVLGWIKVNGKLTDKTTIVMNEDDVVELALPGGGGFGDPAQRDPQSVLEDVRAGFVSEDSARKQYGVVISDNELNLEATRLVRQQEFGETVSE